MKLLYNGQLLNDDEVQLSLSNRAFQFNDGFFETAIIKDGQIRFWPDHLQRLHDAAKTLQLALPESLFHILNGTAILDLAQQNIAFNHGRIKLKVWRSGSGLYTPETNHADWLLTVTPITSSAQTPLKVGICEAVFTSYTFFSHFKGPNSLVYVLAGLEKKKRGYDDMLVLSRDGFVSELISSNIFWIKDKELYTPDLQTGCINGILRRNILRWCAAKNINVHQVQANLENLITAEAVFATNVTGIRFIKEINEYQFAGMHELIGAIQEEWQL
ncbi:aminotransferase class IV [Pontibacter arcticus]|uniref:branched-chain-amino-acid transaminase n=1 Tax=Pontibacter arcticus TaxID=2080288 RepID=A0A364RFW9_9BACT|nr:aminotransferase class IV [Pontibacter arcticus]RAU83240.1 aminotransferase IV [Pontibacter arcticus]